jgi:pimeloyl-ACP methyl ester carboxylesterase
VIAPDQRGYGRSSAPDAVDDYDIHALTGDLVAIIDDADEEQAIVVGHDFGAIVAWNLAVLQPERVRAVVGMSVPFIPRPPMAPIAMLRAMLGDSFFYMVYFQDPGVADAELGADPARTMGRLYAGATMSDDATPDPSFLANDGRGFVDRIPEPDRLPDWLTQAELDHYVAEFTRTGYTGAINWYRNLDRNWESTEELADAHVRMPSLFIGGSRDPVLVMAPPAAGAAFLDDHRGDVIVDGPGHWVHQEQPDPVNAALLDFLDGLED